MDRLEEIERKVMGRRVSDQVASIKYYRIILSSEEGRDISMEETAKRFIDDGYAEKYENIWYRRITRKELRERLFGHQ